MPPVSQALIIANVLVFLLENTGAGRMMLANFALWPTPAVLLYAPWQLVTYSFLHGGFGHIFFNMFAVYMFGGELERVWGGKRFLLTWLASVLAAALMQILVGTLLGQNAPVIGASGGVFGLLLCYGMLFPNRQLMLLFPPIPMPAKVFVALYGALELFLGVFGIQAGVAHFAHLGGMLGGWLMLKHYRGGGRSRRF
jgi:membrane associated rhomboid family serine protease